VVYSIYNDLNVKKYEKYRVRHIVRDVKRFFVFISGMHTFINPDIKINTEISPHFTAVSKVHYIWHFMVSQDINIYGLDNINHSIIAHEYMHILRNRKYGNEYEKYSKKLNSRFISSKNIKYYYIAKILTKSIDESLAEFFEIIYNFYSKFNPDKKIENLFINYIKNISNDYEKYFNIFKEIITNKNYDSKWNNKINDCLNNISNKNYECNWIFGIFIAYSIFYLNDFHIDYTIKELYKKNNLYISKKLFINNNKIINNLYKFIINGNQ